MKLVGREEVVKALAESRAEVTVLFADSGVGKSEVLRAAQEEDTALSPLPVKARNSPGALQRALLDSLSSLIADYATNETTVRRVGRVLSEAASKIAHVRADELAGAVGKHLLGLVRRKVSDEAAQFLSEAAHQLSTSIDQDISRRISSAYDQDVVDVVIELAIDLRSLWEDRPLHLALDDCDRLDEADRRRLMDFCEQLPDGICIRIAFATWDTRTRSQVDELIIRGAKSIPLEELDERAIGEWLVREGLDEGSAPAIKAATNGYAVHVLAAIDLLRETGSLEVLSSLSPNDVLAKQTKVAWDQLDWTTQMCVARLAAVASPLDDERAAALASMDPALFAAFRSKLVGTGIFTGNPPWFHELRRREIWNNLLSPAQKDDAESRAIEFLAPLLALPEPEPENLVEFALLAANRSELLESDPQFRAAAEVSSDGVAILASLIELRTPGPTAVTTETALAYARQVFGAPGELLSLLEELAERQLLVLRSDQYRSNVSLMPMSIDAEHLIEGRAASELGRMPVSQVATKVFEDRLRSPLSPFKSIEYGAGHPDVATLSRMGVESQRTNPDGSIQFGRKGPNALIRFRVGNLSMFASAAYVSEEDRDGAIRRISEFEGTIGDDAIEVRDAIKHPMLAVPAFRFLNACEVIRPGIPMNSIHGLFNVPSDSQNRSLDDEMLVRATTLEAVRQSSSLEERYAYGLEDPIGYVYVGDNHSSLVARVVGRQGAERLAEDPRSSIPFPYLRIELGKLARLSGSERLGMSSLRMRGSNAEDPVLAELDWLAKQAMAFNEFQNRVDVLLEEYFLIDLLNKALAQLAKDVALIGRVMGIEDQAAQLGKHLYLALFLDEPSSNWVPGAHASVVRTHVDNASGHYGVTLRILSPDERPDFTSFSNPVAAMGAYAELFGIDAADITTLEEGVARGAIAELLGYREKDLLFRYLNNNTGDEISADSHQTPRFTDGEGA